MPRAVGTLKVCTVCHETKNVSEYNKNRSRVDGLANDCRGCRKQAARTRYQHIAARQRKRPTWTGRQHAYKLKKYGLTACQYTLMRIEQSDLCAICGQRDDAPRSLAVDHCHETGRIRGLLCSPCNLALGSMRDDPARLMAAARYLSR